jgi:hypothetical protein
MAAGSGAGCQWSQGSLDELYKADAANRNAVCLKQEKLGVVLKFLQIENKILVAMASRH